MNSSLLTVDEPDGFPVDSIVKCIAHPRDDQIGLYLRITSGPENCLTAEYDDDNKEVEGSENRYYGQDVATLDGKMTGLYALSWMRPATPEEIAAL